MKGLKRPVLENENQIIIIYVNKKIGKPTPFFLVAVGFLDPIVGTRVSERKQQVQNLSTIIMGTQIKVLNSTYFFILELKEVYW